MVSECWTNSTPSSFEMGGDIYPCGDESMLSTSNSPTQITNSLCYNKSSCEHSKLMN